MGTWWLATATVAGLVAMMWWCAGSLIGADRKRRVLEAQLYELASHDALTGLLNRHRFEQRVADFLARARRYHDTGALLLIDLDRLKPIDDTLGHAVGDRVLRPSPTCSSPMSARATPSGGWAATSTRSCCSRHCRGTRSHAPTTCAPLSSA